MSPSQLENGVLLKESGHLNLVKARSGHPAAPTESSEDFTATMGHPCSHGIATAVATVSPKLPLLLHGAHSTVIQEQVQPVGGAYSLCSRTPCGLTEVVKGRNFFSVLDGRKCWAINQPDK